MVLSVASIALASGCSQAGSDGQVSDRLRPEYDQQGKLSRLSYDRDGNGKVDTWGYMNGSRVVRIEVDEDGDGAVDRWEYYAAAGAARGAETSTGGETALAGVESSARTLERIERAMRHDGKVSRKEFFEAGRLSRTEEDTDGDGRPDKWETYRSGSLAMMELDTDGHGQPTRRLIYRADGSVEGVEVESAGASKTVEPKTLKPKAVQPKAVRPKVIQQ